MTSMRLALFLTTTLALGAAETAPVPATAPAVTAWMSWEGGVDLACMTKPGLTQPNLILHVARIVHTPVGSAPSGMVVYQPDPAAAPAVFGFICEQPAVGAYFGPNVFAGTPFEKAPVLPAKITITTTADTASSRIEAGGHVFTVTLSGLAATQLVNRAAGAMPFHHLGVESAASTVAVTIDGKPVEVIVPPAHPVNGPAAAFAQTGLYAR